MRVYQSNKKCYAQDNIIRCLVPSIGQEDNYLKKSNETWLTGYDRRSHIVISGLDNRKKYLFSTIVVNGERKSEKSEFTPGGPFTSGK